MKVSSLRLAKEYMKRIRKELESEENENLLLQGVRFAFRVHQVDFTQIPFCSLFSTFNEYDIPHLNILSNTFFGFKIFLFPF